MGINIGICETEAPSAPCKELRKSIVKAHLDDPAGFEQYMEYDVKVSLDAAKGAVGDWETFLKRNRMNPEADAVYMDKVKNDKDREVLEPLSERVCTDGSPWKEFPTMSAGRSSPRPAMRTSSPDGTA